MRMALSYLKNKINRKKVGQWLQYEQKLYKNLLTFSCMSLFGVSPTKHLVFTTELN